MITNELPAFLDQEKVLCDCCKLRPGQWRRQNTQYTDDRSNWVFLCEGCNRENEAYWDDMWAEYYSSR